MFEIVVGLTALLFGGVLSLQALEGFEAFDVTAPFTNHTKTVPSADDLGGGAKGVARQTQTVITGLVIVITASLAVIVVDQFDQSLGTPQSSELSTAQNDVLAGFGDMVSLIGPLLLVLIAVVIVGVVQRLRA